MRKHLQSNLSEKKYFSALKRGFYEDEVELENRPQWSRHLEFVVACIGFTVGFGNVWRFPHLCYTNGGGAFLIPYFTCLVFLGIPIFFLEISFGQFASTGSIAVWEINPLLKGLGYSMVFVAAEITTYYSIIIAIAVYYMFASMQSSLPWMSCGNDWNTCQCRTFEMATDLEDPLIWYNAMGINCTGMNFSSETIKTASEEYYNNKVVEQTSGIGELGILKWDLTLCNLFVWILVYLTVVKGVKSLGKVVYISALTPYLLMTTLLVRGVTLSGASKGVDYYMSVDFDIMLKSKVWKAAASQSLLSLSCCMGGLMTLSSYNKFHSNCIRDSFVIPIINCITSFFAGFAIFTVLGFMSETTGKDIGSVTLTGTGLVFVAYPAALGKMPLPQMWSFLFFLMMLFLGLGSLFPLVETVITSFQDEFPILRRPKRDGAFRIFICCTGFLFGLPETTQGGSYIMNLYNTFIEDSLLLVGLLEVVAILWIYGPKRFSEDMMLMVGYSEINRFLYHSYYKWTLLTVTPFLIIVIIIFSSVEYTPVTSPEYPVWAEVIGWLLVTFTMMWTPIWYIATYYQKGGGRISWKLLVALNQPTPKWGPADPENKTIPRYQSYAGLQEKQSVEKEIQEMIDGGMMPTFDYIAPIEDEVSDGSTIV